MKSLLPTLAGYAHKREALELISKNELTLIWAAYHKTYRRNPREAFIQKEREIENLLAWREYIECQLAQEHIGPRSREAKKPMVDCMPRTKQQWTFMLRETLKERDPLIDFIIGFYIGVMMSILSSQLFDVMVRRDELVEEIRKRLKSLPLSSGSSDGGHRARINFGTNDIK